MRKYSLIQQNDRQIPTKTIKGLKTLIRKGKAHAGMYECTTPSGTTHLWEITTSVYSLKGSTKNKQKVGKGVSKINTVARFVN